MKSLLAFALFLSFAYAQEFMAYYSKNCGCCEIYFSKLEREGFRIKRVQVNGDKLMEMKSQFGVPPDLRSCHTMVYEDRFIEGHVPPEGIRKVIKDKNLKGVASPHGIKSGKGEYEDGYFLIRR
ncbi:MAG: DUF411 domain-containing protein [Aquificaceae bacterium]